MGIRAPWIDPSAFVREDFVYQPEIGKTMVEVLGINVYSIIHGISEEDIRFMIHRSRIVFEEERAKDTGEENVEEEEYCNVRMGIREVLEWEDSCDFVDEDFVYQPEIGETIAEAIGIEVYSAIHGVPEEDVRFLVRRSRELFYQSTSNEVDDSQQRIVVVEDNELRKMDKLIDLYLTNKN